MVSTGISKILSEESLEVKPRQGALGLAPSPMLLPVEVDSTTEERGCKRSIISVSGTGGVEVVFTLLTKVLTLHMGLPEVEVGGPGLQRALSGAFFLRAFSVHADLQDSLQVLFRILGNSRSGGFGSGGTWGGGTWGGGTCITWCWSIFSGGGEFVWLAVACGAELGGAEPWGGVLRQGAISAASTKWCGDV